MIGDTTLKVILAQLSISDNKDFGFDVVPSNCLGRGSKSEELPSFLPLLVWEKSIAGVFYYFANPTLAYSFHESVNKASS